MSHHEQLLTAHILVLCNHLDLLRGLERDIKNCSDARHDQLTGTQEILCDTNTIGRYIQNALACLQDATALKSTLVAQASKNAAIASGSCGQNSHIPAMKDEPADVDMEELSITEESNLKQESAVSRKAHSKREISSGDLPGAPVNAESARETKRRRVVKKKESKEISSLPMLENASATPLISEPTLYDHQTPKVEYDDIDAEVDGRLRANEERRRRNVNGEANPSMKRKRDSGSSVASRESLNRSAKVKTEATGYFASDSMTKKVVKRARKALDTVDSNPVTDVKSGYGANSTGLRIKGSNALF